MYSNAFSFIILVCYGIICVNGDYTATVELRSYINPSHMAAQSNTCCDLGTKGNCSNPCDNRFRFCYSDSPDVAQTVGVLQERPEEIVIGCQLASNLVEIDNDNITFRTLGIFGETVRNPLRFTGKVWPGEAYLMVIVIDVDEQNLHDTVDAIVIHILPSSLRRYSSRLDYGGVYGYGSLNARYRIDCDRNFFGEDCGTFCIFTNNSDGHYSCDRYGNRRCLEGYQNVSTNCTECAPAKGCSPVGGYCTLPGNCICLPDFTGENCTEAVDDKQCTVDPSSSEPSEIEGSSSSSSVPISVYVLGVLVGLLVVAMVAVSVALGVVLILTKRKGKQAVYMDSQSSRGYYMNEGLGPTQSSTNLVGNHEVIDQESIRSSRQYATVEPNQRMADFISTIPDNQSDGYSSSATTFIPHDVPNSSIRPNVAYNGLEGKREENGGTRSGGREEEERGGSGGGGVVEYANTGRRKVPMRPPPRPPQH